MRIDHVALGVESIDAVLPTLLRLGLREGRHGRRGGTPDGARITFVHDDVSGVKLELLETDADERGLLHLAFGVDDVDGAFDALVADGFGSALEPTRIEPARARTAMVDGPQLDWLVQLIAYDPGAPEARPPQGAS